MAAVLVMVYHWEWQLPTTGPVSTFVNHGYLWVDLFFVLSGFVMAMIYRDLEGSQPKLVQYKAFLAHRIARIYPLYLVISLGILGAYLLGRATEPRLSVGLVLTNLLLVQTWFDIDRLNPPIMVGQYPN